MKLDRLQQRLARAVQHRRAVPCHHLDVMLERGDMRQPRLQRPPHEIVAGMRHRRDATATVLDEKGAPLEAAIVYLSWQSALAPTPKGVLTLSSPPGTYLVVVNASGTRARAETVVTVRSGETTQVGTLQLK